MAVPLVEPHIRDRPHHCCPEAPTGGTAQEEPPNPPGDIVALGTAAALSPEDGT